MSNGYLWTFDLVELIANSTLMNVPSLTNYQYIVHAMTARPVTNQKQNKTKTNKQTNKQTNKKQTKTNTEVVVGSNIQIVLWHSHQVNQE